MRRRLRSGILRFCGFQGQILLGMGLLLTRIRNRKTVKATVISPK
jgi:hypothetical protein